MEPLEHLEISKVTLSVAAHRQAEASYAQQKDPIKAEQVYVNTLAIYAVDAYLRSLGILTALDARDSAQVVTQTLMNSADLKLPSLGQLECRPLAHGDDVMYVPEEVWGDRIGYLAVQLNADGSEARLLGFVKTVNDTSIPLSQLESLSTFLDYLDQLEQAAQVHMVQDSVAEEPEQVLVARGARLIPEEAVHRLSQWLDRKLAAGWEIIEDIKDDWSITHSEPAISFRHNKSAQGLAESEVIQCGKVVKLQEGGKQSQLKLLVGFRPQVTEDYEVRVRLSPTQSPYLVPGIKVFLLDDTKAEIFQAQTRSKNDSLQFTFDGSIGDRFSIKIAHENTTFEEAFIID